MERQLGRDWYRQSAVEAKPVSAILAFDTAYDVMLRYNLAVTLLAQNDDVRTRLNRERPRGQGRAGRVRPG
jgi:hypothetical protein